MTRLLLSLPLVLAACAGTPPPTANVRTLPPACVEQDPSAFAHERRPSVGATINDQTTVRVIHQAGSVIQTYEDRFDEQAALERERVRLGCLEAR